ncbi:MAG: electron transfer flavoprotein subunit alpha/FixB family protein [Deltaproteobacteria bacterium]|nr:electron transfer flavoprotein subunit alpha/FixB family protein [Deltaproteobacteria bacterium]MBW1958807.1 electron transfer flavoprotein subunit alpha/FixB family protein [Deltaproteobacteria bacterium]MBW2013912.1 electron transfer flavoprotein subunit alpha/FixB family protein [Deltaproteobacteria bacterium]MBW2089242.1 electron transfer flavoprotein subunit alpha/FixB family protein [Deltaproteobacteria bacterium]MBW2320595.1 electron transfer flavoprotein subunit alpha/FixB family pro
MAQQVFAYIIHKDGVPDDTALELIAAAEKLDPDASVTAVVAGDGNELDSVCNEVASSCAEVWKIENPALAYITAEALRPLLVSILPKDGIVLVPHDHFGMDLAPGLSIKLDAAYLPDAVDFEGFDNGELKAVREEYSGQVSTHVLSDISEGAVITVRPGSFKADERKRGEGQIIDKTDQAIEGSLPAGARRFLEIIEAEVGDVDITKSDILVSVGRGIEDQDNMEIIFELAEAMGGDVSCSRPIVDAKWLEKSRQVGTSGQTVKPKVYMALGISGAFQHVGGLKGTPFVIAINKNPRAPIFQVADVGIVDDILDFIPELTERINELKSG